MAHGEPDSAPWSSNSHLPVTYETSAARTPTCQPITSNTELLCFLRIASAALALLNDWRSGQITSVAGQTARTLVGNVTKIGSLRFYAGLSGRCDGSWLHAHRRSHGCDFCLHLESRRSHSASRAQPSPLLDSQPDSTFAYRTCWFGTRLEPNALVLIQSSQHEGLSGGALRVEQADCPTGPTAASRST
jgi:hypothetical protein